MPGRSRFLNNHMFDKAGQSVESLSGIPQRGRRKTLGWDDKHLHDALIQKWT